MTGSIQHCTLERRVCEALSYDEAWQSWNFSPIRAARRLDRHAEYDVRSCPRCGAENPAEHKFCSSCGLLLATATPPPADETTPGWLRADDTTTVPSLLDDSWLSPNARPRPGGDAEAPEWLRRDELEASVTPAAQAETGAAAQSPDELPDWLRDIADESRQRLEARAQETVVPDEQPVAAPSLSSSDEIPDWLRDVTAEANAPTPAAAGENVAADDTPAWLREPPAQAAPAGSNTELAEGEVVDAEIVSVRIDTPGSIAGETNIPALTADDHWQLDGGTSLGGSVAGEVTEETHARVYDVPADSIWSAQPDRPAPDGTTGQQTSVWATPDESTTAIVPPPPAFQLPSWLEDDDIETTPAAAPTAWSPPSWLEDADADGPPARPRSATWTPPSWLDDDSPVANNISRGGPWLDNRGGGMAVAGGAAVMALPSLPTARPAEGQSAELLQRLLAEPSAAPGVDGAPGRGSNTMLLVLLVVLIVMAALVLWFVAPALGFSIF